MPTAWHRRHADPTRKILQRETPAAVTAPANAWMRKIVLNLVAIALGLALCELVLIAAAGLFPGIAFRLQPPLTLLNVGGIEWVVPREIVPDPVLDFRLARHSPRVDKWGYRNPEVPETCAVLVIGDSMTFGLDVPSEKSWPRALSRLGGLCAYNAAVPGYGPVEYQVVLEETLRLRTEMTAFFARSSMAYVDALPALTAAFDGGVAVFNESDDIHPTEAGQAAIARALLPAVTGP